MNRIRFSAWGAGLQQLSVPRYAVRRGDENDIEAAARSLAGRNGHVVAHIRHDGVTPDSVHYQVLLSRGSWSPGDIWISVPRR